MGRFATLVVTAALAGAVLPTSDAKPPASAVAETEYWSFHSDPWINLHHFLYQWSRSDLGLGQGREHVPVPERAGPQATGADGRVWDAALVFYREKVGPMGHFDLPMLELKAGLLELGGDPAADPPDDIEGIAEHLSAAMPVYLGMWWAEHDAMNRAWIDYVIGDVRRYESRWVETVSRAFGGEWVEGRLRLDASAYGNWAGGYTSNGPAHTVVWTRDPTVSEGLLGLEMVFHESGHASPLGRPLRLRAGEVFEEAGVRQPNNLRHMILFYTAGEVVRRIARERGLPEHRMYVTHELITFNGWSHLWEPVQEHWRPVVHGERGRDDALDALVEVFRN